jgi:geranyl diphosphate synthase
MEYYMQKTYYKTASLISNSCKAIALLAGQTAEVAMLAYEAEIWFVNSYNSSVC